MSDTISVIGSGFIAYKIPILYEYYTGNYLGLTSELF